MLDMLSSEDELTAYSEEATATRRKRGGEEDPESQKFEDALFVVFDVTKESLATVLVLKSFDDDSVPLQFRLTLRNMWAKTTVDHGDIVRVLGVYSKKNGYTLTLDDMLPEDPEEQESYARFLVVEPFVMITSTSIMNSFPCVRKSVFQDQFRTSNWDINYPLVLGNILHIAFEQLITSQDFQPEHLD